MDRWDVKADQDEHEYEQAKAERRAGDMNRARFRDRVRQPRKISN